MAGSLFISRLNARIAALVPLPSVPRMPRCLPLLTPTPHPNPRDNNSSYIKKNYEELKMLNPTTPFLVRDSESEAFVCD